MDAEQPSPEPRTLYPGFKFVTAEVADLMLSRGSVRVGTASDYRVPDGRTGGRADPHEIRRVWQPQGGLLPQEQADAFTRGVFEQLGQPVPAKPAQIIMGEGVRIITGPGDAYLFCYSRFISKTLVRRMAEDFGCNACVYIMDMPSFANELALAIPELMAFTRPTWPPGRFMCASVEYRHLPPTEKLLPDNIWREKDMRFRWQHEGRLVWRGEGGLKPVVAEVPRIIPMLRRFDLSRWSRKDPFNPDRRTKPSC